MQRSPELMLRSPLTLSASQTEAPHADTEAHVNIVSDTDAYVYVVESRQRR